MADSPIDGNGFTIHELFTKARFKLDYYQREYSWSRDSIELLLGDLQRRFLSCWNNTHDRQATAKYDSYFLGPYVYHEQDGVTYLVDGQQRITTLHLLLIHIRRLLIDQDLNEDASDLRQLIYTRQHGRGSFTIDIEERHAFLDALLQDRPYALPANCSPSLQNLVARSSDIEQLFPENLCGEALPHFHDWLLERVCLVGIKALSQENAWEIFESMNDRGVRLGPVDLLKSYLLSQVDASDRNRLNRQWREMLSRLNGIDPNAASEFIKTVLAADYAGTIEEIRLLRSGSTPFHEWIRRHEYRLGLNANPDFTRFVERLLELSKHYVMLAGASRSFEESDKRLHALFYNKYNNLNIQIALIFATIAPHDLTEDVKVKADMIAKFIDLYYVLALVNSTASVVDIEDGLSPLVLLLRSRKSAAEIKAALNSEISRLPYDFSGVETFGFHQNVRQVRYLLARISAYVDEQCGEKMRVAEYLSDLRTFDIEHILPKNPSDESMLKKVPDYDIRRNRLGALLLLSQSRNASLGAASYSEKLTHYRRENMLAASLHRDSHTSRGNARFKRFIKEKSLASDFRAFDEINVGAINTRQALYRKLCELIWGPEELDIVNKAQAQAPSASSRRPRTRYGVDLSDLIEVGMIDAKASVYGLYKKERYDAIILPDGRMKIRTGEIFNSPSASGRFVCRRKSCDGWSFWRVQFSGRDVPLSDVRKFALDNKLIKP